MKMPGQIGAKVLIKMPEPEFTVAPPMHVRRLEQALDLTAFLNQHNTEQPSSDSDSSDEGPNMADQDGLFKEAEPQAARDYYNFKGVSSSRKWLENVLSESVDTGQDETPCRLGYLIKMHAYQKKIRKRAGVNFQNYMYYGAGLVSTVDKYPEIERNIPKIKKSKKKVKIKEEPRHLRSPLYDPDILDDISDEPCLDLNLENTINEYPNLEDETNGDYPGMYQSISRMHQMGMASQGSRRKGKKFKDEDAKKKWEELMAVKRRKMFTNIVKKELGKQHRIKSNKHKEMVLQCKRVASHCVKYARQKALQSARAVKEQQWRMKRLAKENLAYWKRSRKFDREIKKRLEKEAEEQRKIDQELIEAKRQQRKLNFLITQTELYAHFMSKKIDKNAKDDQLRILSQLDEEKMPRLIGDDYDSERMKERARRNAQEAFQSERARTRNFDQQANSCLTEIDQLDDDQPQPNMFQGTLKGYQLKGMNWLATLYNQGISGILADEMGLGKTVQSIAFLCHIAEKYSVWGPFLIISPASTLHNWQQEIAKFVPSFKVVPYWGNPNERKILRQFWDQKDIYTKDASFHIVITSYQIVITDIKYFNRIKWQYMILDEAQAIKSTSSMRWKTLLGFSCRNRLLLSGTPIQNSMAELWALLHFIMPTLFDSHEEFNEWFSKDIESHAENKTGIDEKHLSRLHMILKPFMLRRIKKDVENELSDKIEVMVYCPLTMRQNLLYAALKQKIRIEDLLNLSAGSGDSHSVDKNFTSNLMNLVMQFRKVCNHPELFERRDAKSPVRIQPLTWKIPFQIFDYNVRLDLFLKINKNLRFSPEYLSKEASFKKKGLFNLLTPMGVSVGEMHRIFLGDIIARWKHFYDTEKRDDLLHHRWRWHPKDKTSNLLKPVLRISHCFKLSRPEVASSGVLQNLVFVNKNRASRAVYTHTDHFYHSMPETLEHRNIRLKKESPDDDQFDIMADQRQFSQEFPHSKRPAKVFRCEPTELPACLAVFMPKVSVSSPILYCYSRRAAWHLHRHIDDYSYNALNSYWHLATGNEINVRPASRFGPVVPSCIESIRPPHGWSNIVVPDKESLVTDSGKLSVLDSLLKKLKEGGHRVLIYSQMTKMIDLLEEYMWHRHHKYMRLDGSSKISERRDMVADFQARTDIFVFLLSTRAGGLGINLTAADTVIFYDSDWNPTVDQQAMDRAHRLGQTKQVTVYRLICKGSIEERILQRAREKSEIQKLVISGGNFKPDTLKPKEVVSLLLDDEELAHKLQWRTENRPTQEEIREERKRKLIAKTLPNTTLPSKRKLESQASTSFLNVATSTGQLSSTHGSPTLLPKQEIKEEFDSYPNSPGSFHSNDAGDDQSEYPDDGDSPITSKYTVYNVYGTTVKPPLSRHTNRGTKRGRGRPRGSRTRQGAGFGRSPSGGSGGGSTGATSTSFAGIIGHLKSTK